MASSSCPNCNIRGVESKVFYSIKNGNDENVSASAWCTNGHGFMLYNEHEIHMLNNDVDLKREICNLKQQLCTN
jgi:hypothetical protein